MKYKKQIIGMMVLVNLIVPQFMFAESANTASGAKAGDKFCSNLDNYLTSNEKKLSERDADRDSKLAKNDANIANKRAENDKRVSDALSEALARQDYRFTNIMAKATTDIQKQAITDFQTAIKSAVSTRQTAIGTARNTYRIGVDKVVADRKVKIDLALSTMKTSIETAVAKAKTDCAGGVSSATVKSTLQTTTKSSREAFKLSLKNAGGINDSIKILNEARKKAFDDAQNKYKADIESAKTTLKTKLGSN